MERHSKMEAKRRKAGFGRVKFYGQVKSIEEIAQISKGIESLPLKSEERAAGLEDLCVYALSSKENLETARSLDFGRIAANSLGS